MRPIATDDSVKSCVSIRVSVMRLRCAKTAEQIDVLFGIKTLGAQVALYWGSLSSYGKEGLGIRFVHPKIYRKIPRIR